MKKTSGGILSRDEILQRLSTDNLNKKLYITPIIDKSQIGASSVDIRLGTEFIIFKRTKFSILDVFREPRNILESRIGEFQEKIYIPIGEKLVLHPQQLVLGSSLEYIRLPNDLSCEVAGRSSWGRMGLILSAATLIQPGFAGVITLELANEGETPIPLYPGARIAQLVFHKVIKRKKEKPSIIKSRYIGATGPSFSRLYEDEDIEILRKLREIK